MCQRLGTVSLKVISTKVDVNFFKKNIYVAPQMYLSKTGTPWNLLKMTKLIFKDKQQWQ